MRGIDMSVPIKPKLAREKLDCIADLTRKNKLLRNTLVHCLGYLQTKVENTGDFLTIKKIEHALNKIRPI